MLCCEKRETFHGFYLENMMMILESDLALLREELARRKADKQYWALNRIYTRRSFRCLPGGKLTQRDHPIQDTGEIEHADKPRQ